MPTNVLITFDTHTPYLAFRVSKLQEELVRRGLQEQYRLHVILLAATEATYQWELGDLQKLYGGVPVEVLSEKWRHQSLKAFLMPSAWKNCLRLGWRFLKLRPRIAFVGGYDRPESLTLAYLSVLTRGKVGPLHDSRFNDVESYSKNLWLELAKGLMCRIYDFFMCSGRECVEYSGFLGGNKKLALAGGWDVVDNEGIGKLAENSARDSEIRAHLGVAEGRDYFFMPIRFLPKKNVFMALDAYAAYHAKATAAGKKTAQLAICGQGPLQQEIEAAITRHGLAGEITVRPWLRYEDVPRASRLSLSLVLASTHDQWGMTINEALAAGCPVLCSSRAGAHEVVQNARNGFTFHPWQPESLAHLFDVVAHTPGLVTQLRSQAAESVQSFSSIQFLESCFQVFENFAES
jgi:glycosyltransferase involved in cell wall biosynthesis